MNAVSPPNISSNLSQPRKRRWLRRVVVTLLILVGLLVASPFIASPFVKAKIQEMVSDHLHGRLEIESLTYSFPYGVVAQNATFVADAEYGSVKVLSVKRLDISLAKLPFRKGPIVIRNLAIIEPTVHIIRQKDGSIFGYNLPKRGKEGPPPGHEIKLSDILELHRFDLKDASIFFEDQTAPNELPLEWHDIDAHLNLDHKSKSNYGFAFTADNQPIAHVELAGSADVDSFQVALDKFSIKAAIKRSDTSSALPVKLQALVRQLGLEGALEVAAAGDAPAKNPVAGKFNANVRLTDVALHPQGMPWSMDQLHLNLNVAKGSPEDQENPAAAPSDVPSDAATTQSSSDLSATQSSSDPTSQPATAPAARSAARVNITMNDFDARAMGGDLRIPRASGWFDLLERTWRVDRIDGTLETAGDAATTQAATTDPTSNAATTFPTTVAITSPTTSPATRSLSKYLLAGQAYFTGTAGGSVATPQDARKFPRGNASVKFGNITLLPPGFAEPLRNVTGTIRLVDRTILITDFSADCAQDHFELKQALIPLDDPTVRIQVRDIVASATFGTPMAIYPEPIATATKQIKPGGRFELTGAIGVYLGRGKVEPDYAIQILPRNASVLLTEKNIPITNLNGQINLAPRAVSVPQITGNLFDGTVIASATAVPVAPFDYQADIRLADVDLGKASETLDLKRADGKPKATGKARSHLKLNGSIPNGDAVAGANGHGYVRVADGDLWSLQLFGSVIDKLSITRDAVTAGDAAAVFDLKDSKLQITKLAISSTAVGLQGDGTIGLADRAIDLNLIVAPLGDWRQRIRDWKIPLFSDVAGQFAGAMQKVVNTATSSLLYQFRVGGTFEAPKISAIPAPILTDSVAHVFGTMLKGGKSDSIGKDIGAKEDGE